MRLFSCLFCALLLPILSACAATMPPSAANTPVATIPASQVSTSSTSPATTTVPGFTCAQVTEIPLEECQALVALYQHMDGARWNTNYEEWVGRDLWLATNTPCNWGGVTCAQGHVTELSPGRVSDFPGELPAEISVLGHLTKLNLAENHLRQVSPEIGHLTGLTELELSNNQLSELPDIGGLTALVELGLGDNELYAVPAGLGNLSKLERLGLGKNQLTVLPPEIGNLTNLTGLSLADNRLPPSRRKWEAWRTWRCWIFRVTTWTGCRPKLAN